MAASIATPAAVLSGDDILDHLPAPRCYVRSLCHSVQDANDLVQEALLHAIEYTYSYKPATYLRTWLFTIMRSCLHNKCCRDRRKMTGDTDCISAMP